MPIFSKLERPHFFICVIEWQTKNVVRRIFSIKDYFSMFLFTGRAKKLKAIVSVIF
jgi:hypothetical protein